MAHRDVSGQEASGEPTYEQGQVSGQECPECQGAVRTVDGEAVCADCGLVVADTQLDRGPEWRSFDADTRERTGAPLTPALHDRGLSTEIGYGRDAKGNALSGKKRRQLGRLRREQSRGRLGTKAERNLAMGFGDIRRIVGALELPRTIRDQACRLFRTAQQEDLLRGRSVEAVVAGSVYAVCRCNGLPRTLDEVAEYARCDRSGVENAYQVLNRELELPTPPPLAQEFIPRLASDLDVSERVRARAESLAREAEAKGLVNGCQPSGFAAACLYIAAHDDCRFLTQKDAADAAGVCPITLRSHRDKLREHRA